MRSNNIDRQIDKYLFIFDNFDGECIDQQDEEVSIEKNIGIFNTILKALSPQVCSQRSHLN